MGLQQDVTSRDAVAGKSVLISGASFAGLSMAWWMLRLGYAVTMVEVAKGLRKGGTPVDIREEAVIAVVRRMGLLERILSQSLPPRGMAFLDAQGEVAVQRRAGETGAGEMPEEGYEIERDDLLEMLYGEVVGRVEMLFGDSIVRLEETAEEVVAGFASGSRRGFSMVLGCDGIHSAVRRMCFGEEDGYLFSLQHYFSLTIADRLLLEENTSQMFNTPGKAVMLNAYNGKTDIGFAFFSDEKIVYDRRDQAEQRRMICEQFRDAGWRVPELLGEMMACENFYFDQLSQIRMERWSRGRVALVGDAGYCPSAAAGMGGSMAILGAAALGEALEQHPGDLQAAFAAYEGGLRPMVEQIQRDAVELGLAMFAPRSEEAIRERNAQLNGG